MVNGTVIFICNLVKVNIEVFIMNEANIIMQHNILCNIIMQYRNLSEATGSIVPTLFIISYTIILSFYNYNSYSNILILIHAY